MHFITQSKALLFLIISTSLFQVTVFANESEDLLKEYNRAYDNYLNDNSKWVEGFKDLSSKYKVSKNLYETSSEEATSSKLQLEQAKSGIEQQEQYLNFLNQIEPVSTKKINSVKLSVVNSNEFSSVNQVNVSSLENKAQSLDSDASKLSSDIQAERGKISNIKKTNSVYLDLSKQLSEIDSDLNRVQSRINQATSDINTSEARISRLETSLDNSMRNEDNAEKRIIEINRVELPAKNREKDRLKNKQDDLESDLTEAENDQRTNRQALRRVNRQIDQKEDALAGANPGRTEKLLAEIKALKATRRPLRNKKREIEAEINGLTQSIASNEFDISRINQEVVNLESLLISKENEAAQEAISQIDITSDLEDERITLSNAKANLSNNIASRRSLQSSRSVVVVKIDDFETENIQPIQNVINRLTSDRSNLLGRASTLRSSKSEIIRQENNINKANDLISTQQAVVDNIKGSIEQFEADYNAKVLNLNEAKNSLNTAIRNKNNFVLDVQNKVNTFKEIQNRLLNSNLEEEVSND